MDLQLASAVAGVVRFVTNNCRGFAVDLEEIDIVTTINFAISTADTLHARV